MGETEKSIFACRAGSIWTKKLITFVQSIGRRYFNNKKNRAYRGGIYRAERSSAYWIAKFRQVPSTGACHCAWVEKVPNLPIISQKGFKSILPLHKLEGYFDEDRRLNTKPTSWSFLYSKRWKFPLWMERSVGLHTTETDLYPRRKEHSGIHPQLVWSRVEGNNIRSFMSDWEEPKILCGSRWKYWIWKPNTFSINGYKIRWLWMKKCHRFYECERTAIAYTAFW